MAFRHWLEATHGTVYRVALRILGDPQGAEDVVQEAFVRAWQNMARLKKPQASLGWVCRIARNAATDRLRSPLRREAVVWGPPIAEGAPLMVESTHPEFDPEVSMLAEEDRARVRAAVAALKPKHRTVLLLREVDGLSYEEIATAVGVPRGTVESRIHRARAQMKKMLDRATRREMRSEA